MIRAAASDELSFLHSAVPHIASSSGVSAQPCILPRPHTARSPLETLFSQQNPYAYQLLTSRVSDRTIESLFVVRQQPLTATLSFDPIVLKRKALPAFILAGNDDEKEPSISSARVRMGVYPGVATISSREVGYGTVSPTEDATTRTVAIYRRSKVWP